METEKKVVCALYRRVSTSGQVEEGYSLDEQKELLLQRAEQQGYQVYDIYTDAGISGKNVDGRPAMKRLIKDMKEGKFTVVVAWKVSRTFRNVRDQADFLELMKVHGCYFDFLSEGIIDPNTPSGKMIAYVLSMTAEVERDGISENVYMGMVAKAKSGTWLGGTPPYGYRLIHDGSLKKNAGKLVPAEGEAEVVSRVYDMYVNQGHGYKHICQVLNHDGYRTKKGKLFSVGTIKQILTQETYAGWLVWGKFRNWSEKRRKGATEPIRVRGIHEPLISQELYDKAQKIRLERGGKPKRVHDDLNILTGILRCPECGAGMVLARSVRKDGTITYYSCGRWKNKGTVACHANSVNLKKVNDKVISEISKLINDELIIRGIIRNINRQAVNDTEGIQYDKTALEQSLQRTRQDIKNLQIRFEESEDIEPESYKKRIKELREHEQIYMKCIEECNIRADSVTVSSYSAEEVRQVLARIKPILERSEVQQVRTLMHLMIERIELDAKTRDVSSIKIKINPKLTEYLCLVMEDVSKDASSISLYKNKFYEELRFTLYVK